MQAYHVVSQANRTYKIEPLPLPSLYRKGDVPAEFFIRQATGEVPPAEQNLTKSKFVRTIRMTEGKFTNFGGRPGNLLSVVISGELTIGTGAGAAHLIPGDVFLVDEACVTHVAITVRGDGRLVQVWVPREWPGPDAKILPPGTPTPRKTKEPNILRMYKGEDDRSYFAPMPEMFPAPIGQWSAPRPLVGFRFMCWEDGFIDFHPEVINNTGIFLSGEVELETGDGSIEVLNTGDICLGEDRTGEGHIDRCRGATHTFLIVMDTEHLW